MLLDSCFYPTQTHWIAVKRKMRYLNETPDFGLLYLANDNIIGFSDADWDGDHDDRKSTSGFAFMMSGTAISWNNKKQICVTLSTAEAEYIVLAKEYQESIQRLLMDMNENSVNPMTSFEDNQPMIALTKNLQHHGRATHINIKFHYIREMVTMNKIELKYCKSDEIEADMLTKGVAKIQCANLRGIIRLRNISDCE